MFLILVGARVRLHFGGCKKTHQEIIPNGDQGEVRILNGLPWTYWFRNGPRSIQYFFFYNIVQNDFKLDFHTYMNIILTHATSSFHGAINDEGNEMVLDLFQ